MATYNWTTPAWATEPSLCLAITRIRAINRAINMSDQGTTGQNRRRYNNSHRE